MSPFSNAWSSCTLKGKKSWFVALFTCSHYCPCIKFCICGIATALLHLVSFWKLSNFVHCRTTWGDLSYYGWYYLLLKPAQVWSWELWSQAGVLCEWAQQTPPAGSWPWEDTASPLALELVEECSNQSGLQLTEVSTLSLEVFVPFMLKIEKIIDLAKLGGFLVVRSINTLLKMLSLTCVRQPVSNDLKVTSPFFLMLSWKESGGGDLKIKSPLIYFDYWT